MQPKHTIFYFRRLKCLKIISITKKQHEKTFQNLRPKLETSNLNNTRYHRKKIKLLYLLNFPRTYKIFSTFFMFENYFHLKSQQIYKTNCRGVLIATLLIKPLWIVLILSRFAKYKRYTRLYYVCDLYVSFSLYFFLFICRDFSNPPTL